METKPQIRQALDEQWCIDRVRNGGDGNFFHEYLGYDGNWLPEDEWRPSCLFESREKAQAAFDRFCRPARVPEWTPVVGQYFKSPLGEKVLVLFADDTHAMVQFPDESKGAVRVERLSEWVEPPPRVVECDVYLHPTSGGIRITSVGVKPIGHDTSWLGPARIVWTEGDELPRVEAIDGK